MLRFVAIALVVGLSNAATFSHSRQEGKGVWNFQWNFGGKGNGDLPELPPNSTEPACTVISGCVVATNCYMGQCNSMAEPNTMCYSVLTPPTNCQRDPAIMNCACEGNMMVMPPCPTVFGCMLTTSCYHDGVRPGMACLAPAAEPGIQCYSSMMPPVNCQLDPTVPTCTCDVLGNEWWTG